MKILKGKTNYYFKFKIIIKKLGFKICNYHKNNIIQMIMINRLSKIQTQKNRNKKHNKYNKIKFKKIKMNKKIFKN